MFFSSLSDSAAYSDMDSDIHSWESFLSDVREEIEKAKVSYMVYGCTASVATSSMMTCLAKGKTIEQALLITEDDVENALDGLPEEKRHCSNLGVGALKNAIKNYRGEEISYEDSIF